MQNHFLFLELRDEEICTLLHGLRLCFNRKPSTSNIHITVRGPYTKRLTAVEIEKFKQKMIKDTIRISGVGRFENPDASVVYLRVESQNLESIWWKPDYPKKTYGFNPHISLYSGKDKTLADRVFSFLEREALCLETRQFELTTHVSNQYALLGDLHRRFEKHFLRLILNKKVRADILKRADEVVIFRDDTE